MKTIADIMAIRERMQSEIIIRDNTDSSTETRVVVGMATCGINAGAREVFNTLIEEVSTRLLKNTKVIRSGSIDASGFEPVVEIYAPNGEKVTYAKVDVEKAKKIVEEHLVNGKVIDEYLISKK
ncbi:MAG: (2Fe-2S) ferredoxin domain-containing protein [Clostridia bacterium]|nr:(2Fe-2S) ferredoxin domain-containing protein [Clostridia bacterium]